jgi:hypothetical protein
MEGALMKKVVVLSLVFGLASGANAALSLVGGTDPIKIGETATIFVANSVDDAYTAWLSIENPPTAAELQSIEFTPAGNPGGSSTITPHPEYTDAQWIEFNVLSFPPAPQIAAGNHVELTVIGLSEGTTRLNLYDQGGEQVVASVDINVVPEPMTIGLLGFGGLFLLRRR